MIDVDHRSAVSALRTLFWHWNAALPRIQREGRTWRPPLLHQVLHLISWLLWTLFSFAIFCSQSFCLRIVLWVLCSVFRNARLFCMQDRAKRTYFSLIFMVILIKTCLAQACLTREIAFIADSFSPQPHPNLNLDLVQVQNLQKLWFPSLIDFCPLFFLFTNSPWTLQRLLDVNVHNANMQAKLDALLFDDEAFHWIHERCKIYIREHEFLCMVEVEEAVNNILCCLKIA